MLSAEWSGQLPQCAQPTQRLKGLVVYRTKATDVRQLPADVLEEADEAGIAQAGREDSQQGSSIKHGYFCGSHLICLDAGDAV
eukprot:s3340_g3.t1